MHTTVTPKQEEMINMIMTGKSITEIAHNLEVSRPTIYEWKELETVQARYNLLLKHVKEEVENGIAALYRKAVKAIEECLESENVHIKFKAAVHLLDNLKKKNIGETDPVEIVRSNALVPMDFSAAMGNFDRSYFEKRIEDLGLIEEKI